MCKINAREFAEAEYEIPAKSLNVFTSDNKNFQLINKNEILANGKLYDIVKKETRDERIIYYALADSDEDEYTEDLSDLEKNNSQEKSFPSKTIFIHIAKFVNSNEYDNGALSFESLKDENKFAANRFFYKSPSQNIISPPPDHLSA